MEQFLQSRHHLDPDRAVRAILRFRNEIDRIGSIIYHREPHHVADDIIQGEYVEASSRVG